MPPDFEKETWTRGVKKTQSYDEVRRFAEEIVYIDSVEHPQRQGSNQVYAMEEVPEEFAMSDDQGEIILGTSVNMSGRKFFQPKKGPRGPMQIGGDRQNGLRIRLRS